MVNGDAYSRLRATLRAASDTTSTPTTRNPVTDAARRGSTSTIPGHLRLAPSANADAPTTASVSTAISGTYMRRSAPTSVAMGTILDVGASVTKNHAPRNARLGLRVRPTTVATISRTTTNACGHTPVSVSESGQP